MELASIHENNIISRLFPTHLEVNDLASSYGESISIHLSL